MPPLSERQFKLPPFGEKTWNLDRLHNDFEVLESAGDRVHVRRRSDNVEGTLNVSQTPRTYWGFSPSA